MEEEEPEGAVGAGVWAVPLIGRAFELNACSWRDSSLHMAQTAAKVKGKVRCSTTWKLRADPARIAGASR